MCSVSDLPDTGGLWVLSDHSHRKIEWYTLGLTAEVDNSTRRPGVKRAAWRGINQRQVITACWTLLLLCCCCCCQETMPRKNKAMCFGPLRSIIILHLSSELPTIITTESWRFREINFKPSERERWEATRRQPDSQMDRKYQKFTWLHKISKYYFSWEIYIFAKSAALQQQNCRKHCRIKDLQAWSHWIKVWWWVSNIKGRNLNFCSEEIFSSAYLLPMHCSPNNLEIQINDKFVKGPKSLERSNRP